MSQNESQSEHLLDGTSVVYTYENGSGVEVKFEKGLFHFKWTSGPFKDAKGQEPYRSRKLDDNIYIVNIFMENKSFVTLVYNFKARNMFASVLFTPCTPNEITLFEGGTIEEYVLAGQ
jgi:hypothetical protein